VQCNDAKSSIQDPGSKISVQVITTTVKIHYTVKIFEIDRENQGFLRK
jgi:hypothetical protein